MEPGLSTVVLIPGLGRGPSDFDDPVCRARAIYFGPRMKVVGIVLACVIGVFLVVRAVTEIITLDYGDSASYKQDWGGPSLVGVLAVHCVPGILALALMVRGVLHLRRRTVE